MGSEIFYLREFVKDNLLSDGSLIAKENLEKYFLQNANVSYPTMRNYFYILKMLDVLTLTKDKNKYKLNKNILDSLRD